MQRTRYHLAHMDCPAEEQRVRLKLADDPQVKDLRFDLTARTVAITHSGDGTAITAALNALDLGTTLVTQEDAGDARPAADDRAQVRLLTLVLAINAGLFVIEFSAGWWAESMGLVADSLDMLADALVYGLSLYAIGRAAGAKRRVARVSGYLQLGLAVFGLFEVVRRVLGAGDDPGFAVMIAISLLALAGNAASLVLLGRTRSQEAHIRASQIFTSNDVIVNLGVIAAAGLVLVSGTRWPDLIVGAIVFLIVATGAVRILRLAARA
jgi:Co/Zn/Cd efflux system component